MINFLETNTSLYNTTLMNQTTNYILLLRIAKCNNYFLCPIGIETYGMSLAVETNGNEVEN